MTDRELLELAAKAAGYFVTGWALPVCRRDGWVVAFLEREEETGDFQKWNPLTDDGDALRLAVKLNMTVSAVGRVTYVSFDAKSLEITEVHRDDPLAATRRAIVLAAAEIGKAMK